MTSRIGNRRYSCRLICETKHEPRPRRRRRLVPVSEKRMQEDERIRRLRRQRRRRALAKRRIDSSSSSDSPRRNTVQSKKVPLYTPKRASPKKKTPKKGPRRITPILLVDPQSESKKGKLPTGEKRSTKRVESKQPDPSSMQFNGVKHYMEALDRIEAKYSNDKKLNKAYEKYQKELDKEIAEEKGAVQPKRKGTGKRTEKKKRLTKEECIPPDLKWVIPKMNKRTGKAARPYCRSTRRKRGGKPASPQKKVKPMKKETLVKSPSGSPKKKKNSPKKMDVKKSSIIRSRL